MDAGHICRDPVNAASPMVVPSPDTFPASRTSSFTLGLFVHVDSNRLSHPPATRAQWMKVVFGRQGGPNAGKKLVQADGDGEMAGFMDPSSVNMAAAAITYLS